VIPVGVVLVDVTVPGARGGIDGALALLEAGWGNLGGVFEREMNCQLVLLARFS
jgi:hypothetical protein